MPDTWDGKHICYRCGYKWVGHKGKKPHYCARCKSPYWDKPREKDQK